jgi:BirA family biotin operon repressor/biotin-[acetyl-CoA-carboxylase] ligase
MPTSPPLSVDAARDELAGTMWGPIEWVASTGSTNTDLAARAKGGAAAGLVRIAEHQAQGKGRLGRTWESPHGACVAVSAVVRPSVPEERWTWLPLITGLAVADALGELGIEGVTVKWPNDVLVRGRKICGILAELVMAPDGPAAVLGLGVNVTLDERELPVPTATSLLLLEAPTDKTRLVVGVLRALQARLRGLETSAPVTRAGTPAGGEDATTGDLVADYAAVSDTIGRHVRVEVLGSSPVVGTAVSVDGLGRLGVDVGGGKVTWFSAGDVHHLR